MSQLSRKGLKLDDVRAYGEQTFGELFTEAADIARSTKLAMVSSPVRSDCIDRLVELVVLRALEVGCDHWHCTVPRAEINWED